MPNRDPSLIARNKTPGQRERNDQEPQIMLSPQSVPRPTSHDSQCVFVGPYRIFPDAMDNDTPPTPPAPLRAPTLNPLPPLWKKRYPGQGKYRATYNATKTGNYSLEIVDISDGYHAVGSPFDVLIEAAQAFGPATVVWWDRQVRR